MENNQNVDQKGCQAQNLKELPGFRGEAFHFKSNRQNMHPRDQGCQPLNGKRFGDHLQKLRHLQLRKL